MEYQEDDHYIYDEFGNPLMKKDTEDPKDAEGILVRDSS